MARPRPLIERPGTPSQDRNRLILISYHFAPSTAVGALRWTRMARHFAERGWGLDVLTLWPADGEMRAWPETEPVPPGMRLFGVAQPPDPIGRLERAGAAVKRWLRRHRSGNGNGAAQRESPEVVSADQVRWALHTPAGLHRVIIVIRRLGLEWWWMRRAAGLAGRIHDPTRHRAVITTGPPHTMHESGRRLAERTGLPLVIDLRDPWSIARVVHAKLANPLWAGVARRTERRAMAAADLVVLNTELLRDDMAAAYPSATRRMIVARNGVDDGPLPEAGPDETFTIGFTGNIYWGRDPRPLFRAAALAAERLGVGSDRLRVEMLGSVERSCGVPLRDVAAACGLSPALLRVRGRAPRAEAERLMSRSAMLVSLPWDAYYSIPAKIYEYMRFRAWLLVIARPDSAPARLLADTPALVHAPDDIEGIAGSIARAYEAHAAGRLAPRLADDPRFGRSLQTERLLDRIETITSIRAPARTRRSVRPAARLGVPG